MQNRINNNINFQGGFLINYKSAVKGTQELLENRIGHGKQIFRNWNGDGNSVFYVMKDSKDYNIAQFVKTNELKFQYYPELNTKLRFDTYEPQTFINYLKENTLKVINKFDELMDFIAVNRQHKAIPNSHLSVEQRILNKMQINIDGKKPVTNSKGITRVKDKNSGKIAIFSPQSATGARYVHIVPEKSHWNSEFYMVDNEGNILKQFSSVDGIFAFTEGFNKAIKHHLHLD